MITAAVFYDDTGRIVRVKEGPEQNIGYALESTEFNYLLFEEKPDVRGKFVEDKKLVSVPPRPSKWHGFDFKTKTWLLDINFARSHKSMEIDRSRELHELTSFEWDGYTIPSDESNQRYIHSLLRLAQQGDRSAALWITDNSGTEQKFEAQNCIDIGLALCRHVNESHERARALKLQIKAATTHEELEAIVWE
jgi:hypothetical protein